MSSANDDLDAARSAERSPDTLVALLPTSIESVGDRDLVHALAENPNSPVQLLVALLDVLAPVLAHAGDTGPAVATGLSLCNNTRVPLAAIEELFVLEDTPREFRKSVARETTRLDVLELLSVDRSGKVRKWALTRLSEL